MIALLLRYGNGRFSRLWLRWSICYPVIQRTVAKKSVCTPNFAPYLRFERSTDRLTSLFRREYKINSGPNLLDISVQTRNVWLRYLHNTCRLQISRIVFRTAHILEGRCVFGIFVTISHSGNLTDGTRQQEKLFPAFYLFSERWTCYWLHVVPSLCFTSL